jgi:hypothetical protein
MPPHPPHRCQLPRMFRGLAAPSIGYSQAHTSTRLAAQAASNATDSVTCTCSLEVCRVILMARKTSGDSTRGVSHDIFAGIQDSFTTQGLPPERARFCLEPASGGLRRRGQTRAGSGAREGANCPSKFRRSSFATGMRLAVVQSPDATASSGLVTVSEA